VKCPICGSFLNEISEHKFNIHQRLRGNKKYEINDDSPIMPLENVFRNASHLYNRPPSNSRNNGEHQE